MILNKFLNQYKYIAITIFSLSWLIYFHINSTDDWYGINKDISYLDSIYYTLVTFSTVGYGDITPKSKKAKVVTILIILGLIFNIFGIQQVM